MKKVLFLAVVLGLVVFFSLSALAIPIDITIGFEPVSQIVPVGESVSVDLVISGLGDYSEPSLGAFDLDITYNTAILDFTGYTLASYLGDISLWEAVDNSGGETTPGTINLWEISLLYPNQANDPFYDPTIPGSGFPPYLDDIQPSSFPLATLTFNTLAVGTSSLDISIIALGDAYGYPLSADVQSGTIAPVPEPATFILFGFGLGGIGILRRKII